MSNSAPAFESKNDEVEFGEAWNDERNNNMSSHHDPAYGSMDGAPPTPSASAPAKISPNGIEQLTPGTSRLASFGRNLPKRFSDRESSASDDFNEDSSSDGGVDDDDNSDEVDNRSDSDNEEEAPNLSTPASAANRKGSVSFSTSSHHSDLNNDGSADEVKEIEMEDYEDNGKDEFGGEEPTESEAFQESPWPEDDIDEEDETAEEGEAQDAFAVNESPKAIRGNASSNNPNVKLSKELSTNWMKFDDDKWDASKHSQNNSDNSKEDKQPGASAYFGSSSGRSPDKGPEQSLLEKDSSSHHHPKKKDKKKGAGLSLEAGLAKVSKDSMKDAPDQNIPEAEQPGGSERNELVSFWGEGSEEEEESANDPLSIALKSKPSNNDSTVFKSPKSTLSQLSSPLNSSKSSSLGQSQQNTHSSNSSGIQKTNGQEPQKGGPGWIKKGLGSMGNALGQLKSNLPFSKGREDDEDNDIENNVVEAADDFNTEEGDFKPYQNKQKPPKQLSTMGIASTIDGKFGGSMQDISAISDDSAFSRQAAINTRTIDKNTATAANSKGQTNNALDSRRSSALTASSNDDTDAFDPTRVLLDKMNHSMHENNRINRMSHISESSKGITFAKEVKQPSVYTALPLFDLFVDLPHPATPEADSSPGLIEAPTDIEEDQTIQEMIQEALNDVATLAFPEYDRSVIAEDDQGRFENRPFKANPLETPGFQHLTFSVKMPSGHLIYGHVRRYLPVEQKVSFRYDVGRRLSRALIMFTRLPGGVDFYDSILRTLEAISAQHLAMHHGNPVRPQKLFLQTMFQKHQRLCGHYATNFEDRRGAPHILTIQGLEFTDCVEHYAMVDATHFYVPNHLLHVPLVPGMRSSFECSILPAFRCIGVVNGLRLLSALLSERRVVMVSMSPTRLDQSIRSAMAMLAQGMLKWNHTCVSVLPPDFWSYLLSPSPYLIGILASMAYRLELTDNLGDVVIFNLDENTVACTGNETLATCVPDLCRSLTETMLYKRRIPMPDNIATEKNMASLALLNSSADFLAQDLVEILKSDKQTMNGTSVATKKMAKKATKAVKSALGYFWGSGDKDEEAEPEPEITKKSKLEKRMEPDAVFIEGCRNEAAEEAVQLAFTCFFLRMLGNADGYVQKTEASDYMFDKEKFLRQRQERGDGKGTPMWSMLINFADSEMMQEFARVRENEIRQRQPIPIDAPLFWKCIDFLEMKGIGFGIINVRSVARMLHQKASIQQMLPSQVRRLAMALTSKRKFEGHVNDAVTDLAELSRESASAIYDVMSVIWLRTRDSKGLQWVHGYQAMVVLKAVLLHGPLSAVAHANDGIQTIRMLAFRKSQGCEQIQAEALEIYNLLSDRPRLFLRRRVAGEARRSRSNTLGSALFRDTRLSLEASFEDMHAAMNPSARPPEPQKRRVSLSNRRQSITSRGPQPHRLSISKHMKALEPMDDSLSSLPNFFPSVKFAGRHGEHLASGDGSLAGSLTGDLATARRYVREVARKTAEEEKSRTRENARRRDSNAMGVELLKKQFMLLKVAIYICPIFYFFGNHEQFLTLVMFVWLSQQFQVFRAPIDSGTY